MATFTGTIGDDTIIPGTVSDGVLVTDPSDVTPSDAADRLLGGNGNDTLDGGGGDDVVLGGGGNDRLFGGDGVDSLNGGGGDDYLNGGRSGDIMRGGNGNDTYLVSSQNDDAREFTNDELGGIDTVQATLSHTLGFGIENLTLFGTGDFDGTGNENDNRIIGNSGSNILDGGAGNDMLDGGLGVDLLIGGTGNDRYVVENAGDTVFERVNTAAGGIDTVLSTVDFKLGFGLENLNLRGTASIDGTGNGNNNSIQGNGAGNRLSGLSGNDALLGGGGTDRLVGGSGNDRIVGGWGADIASGGDGNDRFVFQNLTQTGDRITDFRNTGGNNDLFRIDASSFGGGLVAGGQLAASQFQIRSDNEAQDTNDRFIYRTTDDTLWFDRNGSRADGLTLVADLDSGATVTSADIFLI